MHGSTTRMTFCSILVETTLLYLQYVEDKSLWPHITILPHAFCAISDKGKLWIFMTQNSRLLIKIKGMRC